MCTDLSRWMYFCADLRVIQSKGWLSLWSFIVLLGSADKENNLCCLVILWCLFVVELTLSLTLWQKLKLIYILSTFKSTLPFSRAAYFHQKYVKTWFVIENCFCWCSSKVILQQRSMKVLDISCYFTFWSDPFYEFLDLINFLRLLFCLCLCYDCQDDAARK